jgi:hypothetical protein
MAYVSAVHSKGGCELKSEELDGKLFLNVVVKTL